MINNFTETIGGELQFRSDCRVQISLVDAQWVKTGNVVSSGLGIKVRIRCKGQGRGEYARSKQVTIKQKQN